jgi:hypothetical protein
LAKSKKPTPFDVDLDDNELKQLGSDLASEIEDALSARAQVIQDGGVIDLVDWFYEQGKSAPQDLPFPGAADLTSYFITENVDALRARLMKAVFGVRPFAFVEGWGQSASKASYVEEFMDWQVRKSGLRVKLCKVILGALIEDCYILDVSERVESRKITEQIEAAIEQGENGAPIFEDGKPKLKRDPQTGDVIPAQAGQPAATIERTSIKTKRLGPRYTPISMKDFVFLPGHAKDRDNVWGYAYRFWKRVPELEEQVEDGVYDEAAVKMLGDQSDREASSVPRTVTDTGQQRGPAAEKELFQVSLLRDLDGDGREEWYVATISLKTRELLRLKLDAFAQKVGLARCVPFVLFPRRDSVYGYSYGGDKLLTLAEEHTAVRNQKADRGSFKANAPMTQLQDGIWNPDTQPIGVGRVIKVRTHDEVKQMQVDDVPASMIESERMLHIAKERVGGLADSASGVLSAEKRTLGEQKLVAGGSAVRVDEVIGHLHAAIAEVMTLSHAIWVDTLKADPKGLEAPPSVADALQSRGAEFNGTFTPDMLGNTGDFQFEPYGSDETADPLRRKQAFDGGMIALANLAKVFTPLQIMFANPETSKAILEQWMRVYDIRDRQPFLGAFQQAPMMPPAAGPGGPAPMGPPGGAPSGPSAPPELQALIASLTGGGAEGAAGAY